MSKIYLGAANKVTDLDNAPYGFYWGNGQGLPTDELYGGGITIPVVGGAKLQFFFGWSYKVYIRRFQSDEWLEWHEV